MIHDLLETIEGILLEELKIVINHRAHTVLLTSLISSFEISHPLML